jgi:hypothetical protein
MFAYQEQFESWPAVRPGNTSAPQSNAPQVSCSLFQDLESEPAPCRQLHEIPGKGSGEGYPLLMPDMLQLMLWQLSCRV